MATQDVRLTATNPEDSSVVPVACNEKGELKLEEPLVVEGPKGDDGEKGDKGDPGDPFSGNFADNVTFGGSATFAGGGIQFNADGSARFAGSVLAGGTSFVDKTVQIDDYIWAKRKKTDSGSVFLLQDPDDNSFQFKVDCDGSATFAGNKAGFTAEGYLWCTTERGDTVMLEATVGGAGMWKSYTPPRRRDEIKDAWAEKNVLRPKPEDSSQDEPETKQ